MCLPDGLLEAGRTSKDFDLCHAKMWGAFKITWQLTLGM
jgi:hypothetical protein